MMFGEAFTDQHWNVPEPWDGGGWCDFVDAIRRADPRAGAGKIASTIANANEADGFRQPGFAAGWRASLIARVSKRACWASMVRSAFNALPFFHIGFCPASLPQRF